MLITTKLPNDILADLIEKCSPLQFAAGDTASLDGNITNLNVRAEWRADGRPYCFVMMHCYMPGKFDFSGIPWRLLSSDGKVIESGLSNRIGGFTVGREKGLEAGHQYELVIPPDVIGEGFTETKEEKYARWAAIRNSLMVTTTEVNAGEESAQSAGESEKPNYRNC